jgi:hypothetical protein
VREADIAPSATTQSSPSLLPTVPGLENPLEGVPEEETESVMSVESTSTKGLFGAFNIGPARNRNSISQGYWSQENPTQTPPPSFARAGSSAVSDDINMDSPSVSSTSTSLPYQSVQPTARPDINPTGFASRSSTPQPLVPPSAADGLKKSNKRRRDDDLDVNSLKRRAVSPGLSVQNSPVLSQSPAQRDASLWGTATKASRDMKQHRRELVEQILDYLALTAATGGHGSSERSSGSGGSLSGSVGTSMTPSLGPKRVGLQGMTDTSDGLMKMSIE